MSARSRARGTWARLIRAGERLLRAAGIEEPRLDAEVLLAAAIGRTRLDMLADPPARVEHDARRSYVANVRARARHAPVAYLTGTREFMGFPIEVDHRVLIPRPETETLAERAIAWLGRRGRPARVLDLCCGSGCVAIAIARACPDATVVGSDASTDALQVAARNVSRLAPGRVTLLAGNLFEAVASEAPFDLIVANPPYVSSSEAPGVDRSVREHEPQSAWLAGPDPIAFHKRILLEGGPWRAAGGAVMLEFGSKWKQLAAFAEERGGKVQVVKDLAGRPRILIVE